ncbi:MAG: CpsD/CapB family tyrosine-protein kinase, partial [Blautia sp.]|nr:CpsD/CapB family tyrosine-protein kinase [Blautia sp.]
YTPPVLSVILRSRKKSSDPGSYLLQEGSSLDVVESYAKLRMNLLYTMIEKESNVVVISSAVPGEGKSTISANLAISTSWSGKKVLLIDGDMRRAAQREIFGYDKHVKGLSEVLLGSHNWKEVIQRNVRGSLDLLAAGTFPPNPTDLLGSERMKAILAEMSKEYEMIIIDTPPVNIVSDSLTLSKSAAGCLFIVRQNFSDHKYIRKALISMEMTDMDVLGFVFYGEKISDGNFHQRRKYKSYYSKYDNRKNLNTQSNAVKQEPQGSAEKQKNTEKQKPQDTDKQKTVR